MTVWNALADDYERARQRDDSLDRLLDYPCQLRLVGDVRGLDILDLGCGSGAKGLDFIERGASRVVGLDVSETFIESLQAARTPGNTRWVHGDIDALSEVEELQGESFDLVTVLAASLGSDRTRTLAAIRDLLSPNGALVLYAAHPLRWASQRSLLESRPLGQTYFDNTDFHYPAPWNPSITQKQRPWMISELINALAANRFFVEKCEEPSLTLDQQARFPHKQDWLNTNIGGIGLRARPI